MTKPDWYNEAYGVWTLEQHLDLVDELTHAETYRSLTPEERAWLTEAAE